ncbi:MAG TPA: TetR/AcrR family transcriptional regulator [Nocardioidaceae bacterium]|nr:TetR/AcrR family transcriptional regulator [Nocardioidaceae bacterium]
MPAPVTNATVPAVRPRNRRELVLFAAAELFYTRGYAAVSMQDLAEAVGMGPSALYRHFRNKQDVLRVIGIGSVEFVLERLESEPGELAECLATIAVSHRRTGVLVRRERLHLEPVHLLEAQLLEARLVAHVEGRVQAARPDLGPDDVRLLAGVLLGVVWSRSWVPAHPHDVREHAVLSALLAGLLVARLPSPGPLASVVGPGLPSSRREELLGAAIELFARHGFHNVAMSDLRSRAGTASTRVYQELGSKVGVLQAAAIRAVEVFRLARHQAVSETADARAALDAAVAATVRAVLTNTSLAAIALVECDALPAELARPVLSARSSLMDEWRLHLAAVHPDWDPPEIRLRIAAFFVTLESVARDDELRALGDLEATLAAVGRHLLA